MFEEDCANSRANRLTAGAKPCLTSRGGFSLRPTALPLHETGVPFLFPHSSLLDEGVRLCCSGVAGGAVSTTFVRDGGAREAEHGHAHCDSGCSARVVTAVERGSSMDGAGRSASRLMGQRKDGVCNPCLQRCDLRSAPRQALARCVSRSTNVAAA